MIIETTGYNVEGMFNFMVREEWFNELPKFVEFLLNEYNDEHIQKIHKKVMLYTLKNEFNIYTIWEMVDDVKNYLIDVVYWSDEETISWFLERDVRKFILSYHDKEDFFTIGEVVE